MDASRQHNSYTITSEAYDNTEHHYKTYDVGTRYEYDIYHRVNGPALIEEDEGWEWFLEGNLHRYYGPATDDGDWWLNDEKIK